MDYRVSLNLGLGGLGIIGRVLIALAIIFVMRHFDKNNKAEYDKALKWLITGGVVCIVLTCLLLGIFRGLAFIPSALFFDEFFW